MHLAELALFAGLSWTLPVGWQSPPEPPPLRCPAPPGLVAASGATVVMVGSTADIAPRDLARLPERPEHFRLPPDQQFGCLGLGAVLGWQEQGRALSAWVRGGHQRRGDVEALLDSLVVERVPPPPPPAGWDTAFSGTADSIRVPPGWSVRALRVQRGVARPRVLYRLANRDGSVILRVREHAARAGLGRVRARAAGVRRPPPGGAGLPRLPDLVPCLRARGRERARCGVGRGRRALGRLLPDRARVGLAPCRTPSRAGCAWDGR